MGKNKGLLLLMYEKGRVLAFEHDSQSSLMFPSCEHVRIVLSEFQEAVYIGDLNQKQY